MRLLKPDARILLALVTFSGLAFAQSPPATASVELNGKTISIRYCRPYMKGRTIFGGLVPYDSVWRTGANDATALTTPIALDINGTNVPAGNYTLYTLPGQKDWKLIVSKQTGQWGTEYSENLDLARIAMTKSSPSSPVEQFLIEFNKKSASLAELVMQWENTKVAVPVRAK